MAAVTTESKVKQKKCCGDLSYLFITEYNCFIDTYRILS